MEAYILWFADQLWKVYDPMTLELVAEFASKEAALAYINCDEKVVC